MLCSGFISSRTNIQLFQYPKKRIILRLIIFISFIQSVQSVHISTLLPPIIPLLTNPDQVCMSICPYVCQSYTLSACPSVCLSSTSTLFTVSSTFLVVPGSYLCFLGTLLFCYITQKTLSPNPRTCLNQIPKKYGQLVQ